MRSAGSFRPAIAAAGNNVGPAASLAVIVEKVYTRALATDLPVPRQCLGCHGHVRAVRHTDSAGLCSAHMPVIEPPGRESTVPGDALVTGPSVNSWTGCEPDRGGTRIHEFMKV
jgi:hypothetical protein